MTYKVDDLVYFNDRYQKGVGKVVVDDDGYDVLTYLVHSTQIVGGHDGSGYGLGTKQDNKNNFWFKEHHLKPFTKKVGQKYKVISNDCNDFETGDIVTLSAVGRVNFTSYYENDYGGFLLYDLDNPECEVEFYADTEDVKEQKENEMFTKDDLKVGYLVKTRSGELAHVVDTEQNGLCLNYVGGHNYMRVYTDDLINTSGSGSKFDIIEVYGLTENGYEAHKFGINDRKLLWKREEVKEMTIEDIQKALGHKIKVVE